MKQIKKIKLTRIFLFRFLVVGLGVVFFMVAGTMVANSRFRLENDMNVESDVNQVVSYIREQDALSGGQKELSLEEREALQWHLDSSNVDIPDYWNVSESTAVCVLDEETGEVCAKTGENVYICVSRNGEEDRLFRYQGTQIQDFETLNAQLWELDEEEYEKEYPFNEVSYEIVMDGVYLSENGYFTPKKVSLVSRDTEGKEEVLLSYDMKPENVKEYHYLSGEEIHTMVKGPFLYGFGKQNGKTAQRKLDALLGGKRYEDVDLEGILSDSYSDMSWNGSDDSRWQISKVELKDKTYIVIYCATYDFWSRYEMQLLRMYRISLFVGFVILFAWTLYSYKIQKRYYELDQYRKRTTDILAHDLKTPLTAILGYTENLEKQTHPEKAEYYLHSIKENVGYMNDLTEKVLDLGRVEKDGYPIKMEEINVSEEIRLLEEKYQKQIKEKGLQIKVDQKENWVSDRILFVQILDNLIGNAVKYAISGTVIEVQGNARELVVVNHAEYVEGCPVETLTEPFVKGNRARQGNGGSGLGLTIVSHIARILNCRLDITFNDGLFMVKLSVK